MKKQQSSWIKLHQKMTKWEWFSNPNVLVVFIHLLLKANWEDKQWQGVLVKRGSLITSREHLSKETGLTIQQTRTALTNLQSTSEITIKTTNKYTYISINNYDKYQGVTSKYSSSQPTNNQQTNQQITTTTDNIDIKNNRLGEFIDYFNQKAGGKHYQATDSVSVLFSKREKKFGFENLLLAVNNLFSNPFMKGENDRGWCADPTYLLRNEAQVDRFLNATPRPTKPDIKNYGGENGIKGNFQSK